jgi:hypothetical protein
MDRILSLASRHRTQYPRMSGHHAAAIVYEGTLLEWTLSVNFGREHAEARALSRFLRRASCLRLKRGHYCSARQGTSVQA